MNQEEKTKVTGEILKYKKINNRNSAMIIVLLGVLLFVCILMVYVRFFGWFFLIFRLKLF